MLEVFPLLSKVTIDGVQEGLVTCVKVFPKNAISYDISYWDKGSLICVTVEEERVTAKDQTPIPIGFK